MQIHELTYSKKINEGIVDAFKVALSQDPAIDGLNYKQAKKYLETSKLTKDIAKKAQQAWEVYAKQLEQFASTSPVAQPGQAATPATAKPVAPTTPAPGTRIATPGGTVNKTPDGQWKTDAGEVITNPKDVAELERRSKQQITLTAQNKQMSPASGIKEAAPAVAPGGIAKRSATRNAPVAPAATPVATPAAPATRVDSLTAFRNRTDGRYQQALKSFVQKNLLSGMPYNRLANANEIDQIIKSISAPNPDPAKQTELWQQLAQAAAVAYTIPQSAGGLEDPKAGNVAPEQGEPVDPTTLAAAIKNKANIDATGLSNIGKTVRADFTGNESQIKSTGNPAVDTLLKSMGFSI